MGTRPDAISKQMDAACAGLGDGPMRSLARMLAAVDYEHDEDRRVFGLRKAAPPHYENLIEAARNAVDAYRREREDKRPEIGGSGIAFRTFASECTAVFVRSANAGRLSCFSVRDGSFTAARDDVAQWPETEPTSRLLSNLADNLGSPEEEQTENA